MRSVTSPPGTFSLTPSVHTWAPQQPSSQLLSSWSIAETRGVCRTPGIPSKWRKSDPGGTLQNRCLYPVLLHMPGIRTAGFFLFKMFWGCLFIHGTSVYVQTPRSTGNTSHWPVVSVVHTLLWWRSSESQHGYNRAHFFSPRIISLTAGCHPLTSVYWVWRDPTELLSWNDVFHVEQLQIFLRTTGTHVLLSFLLLICHVQCSPSGLSAVKTWRILFFFN